MSIDSTNKEELIRAVPTNISTGCLGVGKTFAILHKKMDVNSRSTDLQY